MIDGNYKEPKLADAYHGHGDGEADTAAKTGAQGGDADERRAAGCPF